MKTFTDLGLPQAGVKLIGTGDITDDDILNGMGDVAVGVVTSHHYSTSHNSAVNKKFVAAFEKANAGLRPNFMAVGGYDGMRVIYEAAKATKGGSGEALLAAMKGQIFESPRGPMFIDAQTRDVVHNIYIRKVERVKSVQSAKKKCVRKARNKMISPNGPSQIIWMMRRAASIASNDTRPSA